MLVVPGRCSAATVLELRQWVRMYRGGAAPPDAGSPRPPLQWAVTWEDFCLRPSCELNLRAPGGFHKRPGPSRPSSVNQGPGQLPHLAQGGLGVEGRTQDRPEGGALGRDREAPSAPSPPSRQHSRPTTGTRPEWDDGVQRTVQAGTGLQEGAGKETALHQGQTQGRSGPVGSRHPSVSRTVVCESDPLPCRRSYCGTPHQP